MGESAGAGREHDQPARGQQGRGAGLRHAAGTRQKRGQACAHRIGSAPLGKQESTTIYPCLSLGQTQRFASKGGYIARFASAGGFVAESDWITP